MRVLQSWKEPLGHTALSIFLSVCLINNISMLPLQFIIKKHSIKKPLKKENH